MAENNATNPFLNENEAKKASSPILPPSSVYEKPNEIQSVPLKKPIEMTGPKLGSGNEDGLGTSSLSDSRKKWLRFGIIIFLILLIAGGIYWWWQRTASLEETESSLETSTETPPSTTPIPVVTDEAPIVIPDDFASYESENFKAGEIVFLGEAEFLLGDEGIEPLTLEGIRGEAFTEKNKQEVKLVISWKTNKLSQAEISYAKGIGQAPTTVSEDDYSYNHSMIITGLDPASTYLYTVKASDRFGNVVASEPYAVFTGARSVSLFDLIAGAIGDVFGWAVK